MILGQCVHQRRQLVEEEVSHRGGPTTRSLGRKQLVEPVEERRDDSDLTAGAHPTVRWSTWQARVAAVASTRARTSAGT